MVSKSLLSTSFKWLLILLPFIFIVTLISLYGVNTLFIDDFKPLFDFLRIKESGIITWADLVKPVNEHRIVFPKLLIFIIAAFTHYNTKAMMFFSAFLIFCSYLIFARFVVGKKISDFTMSDSFYTFIFGMCLTSAVQYENILWGFQLAWFLIEFCVVLGLVFLGLYIQTSQKKYIFSALLIAFISSFSSLHGLAVWPCYVLTVIICQLSERKFNKTIWFYILFGALITFALYFYNFNLSSQKLMPMAVSFKYAAIFVINTVGSVLMFRPIVMCLHCEATTNMHYIPYGILIIILACFLILHLIITKKVKNNILPIGCIIFGIGFSIMVGIGRSVQIGWGTPSRYTTYPLLTLIGVLALLKPYISFKHIKGISCFCIFTALMLMLTYSDAKNALYLPNFTAYRLSWQNKLLNYREEDLFYIKILNPDFKTREDMASQIQKVENARLSVFYRRDE